MKIKGKKYWYYRKTLLHSKSFYFFRFFDKNFKRYFQKRKKLESWETKKASFLFKKQHKAKKFWVSCLKLVHLWFNMACVYITALSLVTNHKDLLGYFFWTFLFRLDGKPRIDHLIPNWSIESRICIRTITYFISLIFHIILEINSRCISSICRACDIFTQLI